MGTTDQSESQALISEKSRERGRDQGRGHHMGNAYYLCRDREVVSTYAACEGRVWMANNTASRVVGKGSVRFVMADGKSVALIEGELPPNISPVVFARRMDKGSYRCTKVRKASAGVPRGSGALQERIEMLWNMYRRHLGEKVQALRYRGAYTSVGSGVGISDAVLQILWGSWIRSCQDEQLEDIGLPSSGLEGEIVESNPSG
ncbi:hypothetical protein Acr_02g0010500 [Actinidia rufa]|uniref:Uncharacterized protein n=1 Tax=Actinidia rufa TaxID=165716 RepID=A0A7J0E8T0_9ERIC|nr:hypothetical protein Acr_02g0010500 [Actinidia rufa]